MDIKEMYEDLRVKYLGASSERDYFQRAYKTKCEQVDNLLQEIKELKGLRTC